MNQGASPSTVRDREVKDTDWTLVKSKKQGKKVSTTEHHTIFLHGIPSNARAREIWDLFKSCGKVFDIIFPRKRDKRNSRFGFVKTSTELEAGLIINNAKEKGGLGLKIKTSINPPKKVLHQEADKSVKIMNKITDRNSKMEGKLGKVEEVPLAKKMFEYIEADVDDEVERGIFETKVRLTWEKEMEIDLQEKLKLVGYDHLKVVGLTE